MAYGVDEIVSYDILESEIKENNVCYTFEINDPNFGNLCEEYNLNFGVHWIV